jgi:hypothetical protein
MMKLFQRFSIHSNCQRQGESIEEKESGPYIDLTVGVGVGVWSMLLYNENGTKEVEPDFAHFVCLHS